MNLTSITRLLAASLTLSLACTNPGAAQEMAERAIPQPLPSHPGNIFVAGEEVEVSIPDGTTAWCVVDYDGKVVAEGQGAGRAKLGRMGVGYYELQRDKQRLVSLGVVAPLAAPTPKTSPVCCDVSMAWFYQEPKFAAVANLCALAGINRVRDRLNWAQMETARGKFSPPNQYDKTAAAQSAAGLQILQVNHHTAKWAGPRENRFPPDLRDAYNFYREMAKRWRGQVQAFEPWNEADWVQFGGHSGAEMATFQKACYWGLKAGNPDVMVCQNVFANYFPRIAADFRANQPWPYFETLNFHHYWPLDGLPKYYGQFRAISGGRTMWVTECNLIPIKWVGDPKMGELAPEEARRVAERVARIFAISLHEGASATYWFIFPHFTEGENQFGTVRSDLTPRPAYLALAAVGRLLADAKPIGQLKSPDKAFAGYLFRAWPDGKEQTVLVAWANKEMKELPLKLPCTSVFDVLGRAVKTESKTLSVNTSPLFAILPPQSQDAFDYTPAQALPPMAEGKPSPVVLQAVWPEDKSASPHVDWLQSCYHIGSDGPEHMPVFVYNFGQTEAKGKLTVTGPKEWKLAIADEVSVAPMGCVELGLEFDLREVPFPRLAVVQIHGDFSAAGTAMLSLRLLPELRAKPKSVRELASAMASDRWKTSAPKSSSIKLSNVPEGMLVEFDMGEATQRQFDLAIALRPEERPAAEECGLVLPVDVQEGKTELSVEFGEDKGPSFPVRYPQAPGAISLGHALTPAWSTGPERAVNPLKIGTVRLRCGELKTNRVRLLIGKCGWASY